MFRRAWWARRRVVATVTAVLLAAGAWVSGTDGVSVGQPLDEAQATLRRAGATNRTDVCGMHTSLGARQPGQVKDSMWELPDGRTLYLVATRDSDDEPFRVDHFNMWQGWYQNDGIPLPHAGSVRLRRSVFAVLPR